jgi:DNA-directed RNA polymerase subunit RPC12/RpoP
MKTYFVAIEPLPFIRSRCHLRHLITMHRCIGGRTHNGTPIHVILDEGLDGVDVEYVCNDCGHRWISRQPILSVSADCLSDRIMLRPKPDRRKTPRVMH